MSNINVNGIEYTPVVNETASEAPASQIATTLKDVIFQKLAESGSSEVGALEVVLTSGETFQIASENHPALSRLVAANDVLRVTKKQTVEAGR